MKNTVLPASAGRRIFAFILASVVLILAQAGQARAQVRPIQAEPPPTRRAGPPTRRAGPPQPAEAGRGQRSQLADQQFVLAPFTVTRAQAQPAQRVVTPDPVIQEMISRVLTSTAFLYDGMLSGEWPALVGGSPYTFTTRWSGDATAMSRVTQYAYEHLQSLGLATSYGRYYHPDFGSRRNVVAEQRGLLYPERVVMITAHIDDSSEYANLYAPGADDNASGSTGVLIAADVLSQYRFGCTIRYALFTGEEQGLYGSRAYAAWAAGNLQNIEAVVNLDMIGYNADNLPVVEVHTRPSDPHDAAIANLFADVISAYNIDLIPQIWADGVEYSDHASFWARGYPAITVIEDTPDFTPFYHTTGDRLSTLDINYLAHITQASIGTLAHMGCLSPIYELNGYVSDMGTAHALSATVSVQDRPWLSTHSDPATGYYTLSLPAGEYTLLATAPGYRPASQTVSMTGDAQVNWTLQTALRRVALTPGTASGVGQPGENVTYTLQVTNTGGLADSLDLEAISLAWSVEAPTGTGVLAPGAGMAVTVVVHIPEAALPDDQAVVTVTARSQGDPVQTASAVLTTQVEGGCVPVAGVGIVYDPLHPRVGEPVSFAGSVMTGTGVLTFTWSFGDGTPQAFGENVTHTFPLTATWQLYTVTLAANNSCGQDAAQSAITIQPWRLYLPVVVRNP